MALPWFFLQRTPLRFRPSPPSAIVDSMTLALAAWAACAAPSKNACPPSCAQNELVELFDRYCSDKGTFWQSKHHYGSAYHSLFGSLRESVRSILEVGIGEDTAPSVAAWLEYFPHAHIYPVDIKTTKEVADRARPGGSTDRLVQHQAKFGCEVPRLQPAYLPTRLHTHAHNIDSHICLLNRTPVCTTSAPPSSLAQYEKSMWSDPRVHLTLDTDASNPEQLGRVTIPPKLDIIIDDGSHRFLDQEATLLVLWCAAFRGNFRPHRVRTAHRPTEQRTAHRHSGHSTGISRTSCVHMSTYCRPRPRLRDGGFYIVEDMLVSMGGCG